MGENINDLFRNQETVAKLYDLSERTLERWRVEGAGPAFHKIGKRVLYADSDLREWEARQRRTSTSDHTEAREVDETENLKAFQHSSYEKKFGSHLLGGES